MSTVSKSSGWLVSLLRHLNTAYMSPDLPTKWTIPLIDAGDGSGDAILTFPDEPLESLGWNVGDELLLDIVGNSILFTKL